MDIWLLGRVWKGQYDTIWTVQNNCSTASLQVATYSFYWISYKVQAFILMLNNPHILENLTLKEEGWNRNRADHSKPM